MRENDPMRRLAVMKLPEGVLIALVGVTALGAQPDPIGQHQIEPARPVRMVLDWPGALDREAYVILQFDVLANGDVTNIRLVDDGFHETRFVNAAIDGLKRSNWRPRRVNGKAVDTLGLGQGFRFAMRDIRPGTTQEFRDEAQKVQEMLKQGDFAGAERHAEWMLASKVKLNYEYALLQAQLAQTYAGLGRVRDAVRQVSRATARTGSFPQFLQLLDKPPPNDPSNYLLGKDLVVPLLEFRMRLLAAQGLALEAMHAYYELAGLEQPAPGSPAVALAEQLTAQIRGTGSLRGKIELGAGGRWLQFLSRRRFALENVRGGSIKSVALLCTNYREQMAYVQGKVWEIPEGLGTCKASISADPGTAFDIVELGDEP